MPLCPTPPLPQPQPSSPIPIGQCPRASAPLAPAILRLLGTLVAYGRNLVETLRQNDDPNVLPWFAFLTGIFGTTNPALITVFIIRGLLRAAALQARLSRTFAGGLDPKPITTSPPSPRKPHPAGWVIPPGWPAGDPSLDHLPTPEEEMFAEITAEDRRRPIGAILLDICLDLGIVPEQMDPATWDELRLALTLYGGGPAPLVARGVDAADPAGTPSSDDSPIPAADSPTADHRPRTAGIVYSPWPAPFPRYLAPAGTGPR